MTASTTRLIVIVFALGGLLTAVSPALADQPFAYDGFNHPTGTPINGQGGGNGWAMSWITPGIGDNVIGSPLTYAGLQVQGNGLQILDAGRVSYRKIATNLLPSALVDGLNIEPGGGDVWVSFLAQRDVDNAPGGLTLLNDNLQPQLFIGVPAGANSWSIGGAAAPGAIQTNSTYFLVAHLFQSSVAGADQIDLYVDPIPGAAIPAPAPNASISTLDVDFNTVQFSAGPPSLPFSFDEIRVGATYAAVSPVPEPATAAFVAVAAVALLGRRKKFAR